MTQDAPPPHDLAVVVIDWNKAARTRQCVAAAKRATGLSALWIVVDNGSDERFTSDDPAVVVIRNHTNTGFAGGANTGLRHAFAAGASYVWLLNNDAEPLPGALDALVAAARHDPAIGLASAVLLDAGDGDRLAFCGGSWDRAGWHSTADPDTYAAWAQSRPQSVWLPGTALLVTRAVIERVGYLDENFFAYWEDNDLSIRSAAAGFRNVMVPAAMVRHDADNLLAEPGRRPPYYYYYMTRNELLLLQKRRAVPDPKLLYWVLRRGARLLRRLEGFPEQRRAVLRGLADGLLRRGGPFRTRTGGAVSQAAPARPKTWRSHPSRGAARSAERRPPAG